MFMMVLGLGLKGCSSSRMASTPSSTALATSVASALQSGPQVRPDDRGVPHGSQRLWWPERVQLKHDGIHAVQHRIGHICGLSPAGGDPGHGWRLRWRLMFMMVMGLGLRGCRSGPRSCLTAGKASTVTVVSAGW